MGRAIDKDNLIEAIVRSDQIGSISTIDDIIDIIEGQPVLPQPSNEALTLEYREYRGAECGHEWMEDCDATAYPNYCPGCGNELRRPPEGETNA